MASRWDLGPVGAETRQGLNGDLATAIKLHLLSLELPLQRCAQKVRSISNIAMAWPSQPLRVVSASQSALHSTCRPQPQECQ
jgi:hypothetical protein